MATTPRPSNQKYWKKTLEFPAFEFLVHLRRHKIVTGKPSVKFSNYKPIPLRWPFLASVFFILCFVVALLEYARHVLPVTEYSTEFQALPHKPLRFASGPNATVHARMVVDMISTSTSAGTTQSLKPWAFKNSTIATIVNDTGADYKESASATSGVISSTQTTNITTPSTCNNESTAPKGSIPATSSSGFQNKTIILNAVEKYPSPSNFAEYNPSFGPRMRMTWACLGDATLPGQYIIFERDKTYFPGGFCILNISLRTSDNPSDCLGQWIWGEESDPPPWTSESPNGIHDNGWNIQWENKPGKECGSSDSNFHCVQGCSVDSKWFPVSEASMATTTFQIKEVITMTSQLPASQIEVVEVFTGSDGHSTREILQTILGSAGSSIFTIDVSHIVTATGYPSGRIWEWTKPTPTVTNSLGGFGLSELPNSNPLTVTILSTITLGSNSKDPTGILSKLFETLFDSDGVPTATVSMKLDTLTGSSGQPTATVTEYLDILTGLNGLPEETLTMRLAVLTDGFGRPTATVAEYPKTITDSKGLPTKTIRIIPTDSFEKVMKTPVNSLVTIIGLDGKNMQTETVNFETLTDSAGQPTATIEEFTGSTTIMAEYHSGINSSAPPPNRTLPISPTRNPNFVPIEPANYFIATFLPVLVSVFISIFIQMVDKNLKTMLPFYALTRPKGAAATDSLCVKPGGFGGPIHSMRLMYHFKEPLSLLCDILVLLTALLVSISSEAIGIKITGTCEVYSFSGCSIFFNIFKGPFRVIEGLLVAMAVLIALISIFIYPLRSGIAFSPWSIASSASLVSKEIRNLILALPHDRKKNRINTTTIVKHLEGKRFTIGSYSDNRGNTKYGIITVDNTPSRMPQSKTERAKSSALKSRSKSIKQKSNRHRPYKQFIANFGFRITFLAILLGLLILILYYDSVVLNAKTSSFERFIDSQKFGVRTLFTASGVIISFFWDDMFSRVTRIHPYKELSRLPRRSNSAISASSATTVFPGLWTAICARNIFTGIIAFAGILSKITPILLSNIPFRVTQTWETHKLCAWMTVAILIFMILIIIWSLFVKWPYIPVDPSTIVGNMYYLCDEGVLRDFERVALMGEKEFKMHMGKVSRSYRFGEIIGADGNKRMGIFRDRSIASLWM